MENKNLKKFLESLEDKSFDLLRENCEFDIKENGNLYMLSFNDKNDLNDDIVREVNGIILEKNTNKLVHYSFQKIYDSLDGNSGDCYNKKLENYRIELLVEGTLIKVFYYENEWKIGTSRNIDAVYSYWGSEKSFKELFIETLECSEIKLEELDKNYCYSFILQHPEVTIGYDVSVPDIIPLNKVNLKTYETTSFMDGYILNIKLEDIDFNSIIITDDNKRIKMLTKEYKKVQELLDNNPSINWAYLKSLQEGNDKLLKIYFQNKIEIFNKIDDKFTSLVNYLHQVYYKRFINKQEVIYEKKYAKTLYELHKRYKETGEKTSKDVIYNYLLNLKTNILYKLLNV